MKAVFIVEGTKDKDQINKAFEKTSDFEGSKDVIPLVTEGTKMNNRIMAEIENYLRQGVDVYTLSDPDEAGARLAQMINYWYPDIPRVNVDERECAYFTGKKFKAGIEYASYNYLRKIICPYIGIDYKEPEVPICWD